MKKQNATIQKFFSTFLQIEKTKRNFFLKNGIINFDKKKQSDKSFKNKEQIRKFIINKFLDFLRKNFRQDSFNNHKLNDYFEYKKSKVSTLNYIKDIEIFKYYFNGSDLPKIIKIYKKGSLNLLKILIQSEKFLLDFHYFIHNEYKRFYFKEYVHIKLKNIILKLFEDPSDIPGSIKKISNYFQKERIQLPWTNSEINISIDMIIIKIVKLLNIDIRDIQGIFQN